MNLKKLAVVVFSLLLMAACVISGAAVINSGKQSQANQIAMAAIQATADANMSIEQIAIQSQAGVAKAGFTSNAAIAASGDLAQASMVKSFSSAMWGFFFSMIALIAFTMIYLKNSGKPKE